MAKYRKNTVVIRYKDEEYVFHFRTIGMSSLDVVLYEHGDPSKQHHIAYYNFLGYLVDGTYHMYWQLAKHVVDMYVRYKAGDISKGTLGSEELDKMQIKEFDCQAVEDYIKTIKGENKDGRFGSTQQKSRA
jgi:hypothetical protein